MARKVKSVFCYTILSDKVGTIEYYIGVSDGRNNSLYPSSAPQTCLTSVVESTPSKPSNRECQLRCVQNSLAWDANNKDIHWYKIYRSKEASFVISLENYVTFVGGETCGYTDTPYYFDGTPMKGNYYYRITGIDRSGLQRLHSDIVKITYP